MNLRPVSFLALVTSALALAPRADAATVQYDCTGALVSVADLQAAVALANTSASLSHDCITIAKDQIPSTTLEIVDGGVTIAASGNTIAADHLANGDPLFRVIGTRMSLQNAALRGQAYDAGEDHRAITTDASSEVTIVGGTVTAFRTLGPGVIHSLGILRIEDTELSGNYARGFGGAVYHAGSLLEITGVSMHDNQARYGGGALAIDGDGPATTVATITGSSFHENVAGGDGSGGNPSNAWPVTYGAGGGLHSHHAELSVTNSTFSNNVAEGDALSYGYGGNLYLMDNYVVTEPATFLQVTVADGEAGHGESLYANFGDITFDGSIVSSMGGTPCYLLADLMGTNNVLSEESCTFVGGNQTYEDPQLQPLDGFPAFRPIDHGTVAVDLFSSSDPECASTDQRGVARPQANDCDAGAFEAE